MTEGSGATERDAGRDDGRLPGFERERARVAARLDRRTSLTATALFIDRLVAGLWPVFVVAAVFFSVTALGLWPQMEDWVRFVALGAFALAFLSCLGYFARSFRWPRREEARAELDAGRPERPVASFDDTLALGRGNAQSQSLWRAHQVRIAKAAAAVRAVAPTLRVGSERDPYALRLFAALGLGASLLLGPSGAQLGDAFAPPTQAAAVERTPKLEFWVTPPSYTGVAPLYFADAASRVGERRAPAGSLAVLRVYDTDAAPELVTELGGEAAVVTQAEDGSFVAEFPLDRSGQVVVRLEDATLVDLTFDIAQDEAPTVALVDAPERGRRGALTFSYSAGDDYGVVRASARITLDQEGPFGGPPESYDPIEFELAPPLNSFDFVKAADDGDPDEVLQRAAETVEQEFRDHEWVGLPVVMVITVEDGAGQQTATDEIRFELPGRRFSEPMAKALMEQRGRLVWNRAEAPRANRFLETLLRFPEDYFTDPVAFLMTRAVTTQLGRAISDARFDAERDEILSGLYLAAERLEEGGLENARERMMRARRKLREAIESGASEEEIAELMQELREAIAQYLEALRERGEQDPSMAEQQQGGENTQTLTRQQLQEMLDALEEAARNGEINDAEQMLALLEQLLDSLQPGGQQQAGEGEGGDQEGALGELQDMIGEQQGLAERSFDEFRRQRQEGQQPGEQPGGEPGRNGEQRSDRGGAEALDDLRRRQQALRDALREYQEGLGEQLDEEGADAVARALEEADRAMREAERALEEGAPGDAAEDQMRAVDSLRDGARAAAEALARADAERREEERRQAGENGSGEEEVETARDPLGRNTGDGGSFDGDDVDVPGASAASRALDLMKEIQRRVGERGRSKDELDYFDRLLDRF